NHYGTDHPQYATRIYNLGDALRFANKPFEGEKYLRESEKIRAKTIGRDHPRYAETINALAILSWDKEDPEAHKLYNDLFENYFHQVDKFFTVMSEEEKASFFNNRLRTGFEQYNSYVLNNRQRNPDLPGEMYDYVLATKGLIMYSTQKIRLSILNSGNEELIEKYNTWINNKEQLSKLFSQSQENIEKSQRIIDSLNVVTDDLEKELSLESEVFGKGQEKDVVTWQDIQKTLNKDEAVVELVRVREFNPGLGGTYTGEIRYAALILTSKTKKAPKMVIIEDGKGIEKRYLSVYRNSIRFKMDDPHSYNHFWEVIDKEMKGIKQVYFSPDGVFNQISINTLYDKSKKEYLIDRYNITQVTNSRDVYMLKTGQFIQGSSKDTYLFGFPNYNMGMEKKDSEDNEDIERSIRSINIERSINRGLRGMDRSLRGSLRALIRGNNLLQMLPGTRVEVENIAGEFKDSDNKPISYLENEAIEERVKEVQDPKTLHIATHGFFLADQQLPEGPDENLYYDNPLLRSGLIMAGVNNFLTQADDLVSLTQEDGILTAYEAMNMDLDDTDMIVLSACETGLGTISNGEGVYGLQRAFQIAGAKSLIMSLWSVDDDATQELMSAFYKNWIETGDKLGAFRVAQFQVKEKYKYPFFWGAFVLVGM
ncbi:CHAT domain-containing protein, partial [Bacteroidota bacterium]